MIENRDFTKCAVKRTINQGKWLAILSLILVIVVGAAFGAAEFLEWFYSAHRFIFHILCVFVAALIVVLLWIFINRLCCEFEYKIQQEECERLREEYEKLKVEKPVLDKRLYYLKNEALKNKITEIEEFEYKRYRWPATYSGLISDKQDIEIEIKEIEKKIARCDDLQKTFLKIDEGSTDD